MSELLCSKCGNAPRLNRNSLCKACLNAAMRKRRADEIAGLRPVGICPRCKAVPRKPGFSYCAECDRTKARVANRRQRGLEGDGRRRDDPRPTRPGLKYCTGCGRTLAVEFFPTHPTSADGRRNPCKFCRAEQQRNNRAKKRSLYREIQRRSYYKHREERLAANRERKQARKLAKLKGKVKELGL